MAKETVYNNTLVSGAADETLTYTRYIKDESSGKSTKELLDEKVNKTDQLGTTQIADKAVTTEKLENESVTTDKLNAASVTTDKVADANITTSKLADSSVETEKINNKAVTTDKLNDGAVDNSKLSPNAVTSEKIKDESIITEKINNRAVTTEKVEDKAITNTKIRDSAVDGRTISEASVEKKHLANDSVTTEKLQDSSVTSDKIHNDAITEGKIKDSSVSNSKLADNSVGTSKIKDGNITNEKVANNTLTLDKLDPELRKSIQAATGLPENLVEAIQNVDKEVKSLHSKDNDLQSQITDKQQQITAHDKDIELLQARSTQMEQTINNIAATGGASVANTVAYTNTTSGLESVNAQGAIDELAAKNKSQDATISAKAEKSDVQEAVSELKEKDSALSADIAKKFDKESILQESGEAEDKVMSQKAVSTKLSDLGSDLSTKLPKDNESDSSVSDGSEEFVVADSNNNIALKVDNEGTKVKALHICDENGSVVKIITKELLDKIESDASQLQAEQSRVNAELEKKLQKDSDFDSSVSDGSEEFVVADSNNNIALKVDNEGTKVKALHICDENGSVVKIITKELLDNIEKNKQNNLWWKDKNIFLLGDSLGQIQDIQRVFSQYSMSNWYTEYVSAVLSSGGTQTLSRYTLDHSGDERAMYLKQIQEDRGLSIDVIFFMTINDGLVFYENVGTKHQEPYFEFQVLRSQDIPLSSNNYKEEFKSNFTSILANAQTKISKALTYGTTVSWSEKGAVSPKGHTLLFVPTEYENANVFKLKINKGATVSGSIKIKSNITGFKEHVITISAGDSIKDILNKILICDFGNILDIAISDTEITFTNIVSPENNNISIECSSEDINALFSLSNTIGKGYVEKAFVYKSLDTTNWNNADYWVLRDTEYTSENDPQSSKFGPSAWQVYGGVIQYLQLTFPRALIIGLYPTIGWGKTDGYKYKNSEFIDYAKFRSENKNAYEVHRKVMKEIFNYYCCPFIDFNECSGMSAINAIPGGFYPSNGDVHPFLGDNGGSARWGVTLANVLL